MKYLPLLIILTTLWQILIHRISTWLKLFHDLSINQFEKCFRLDCSRLIIQMHIHSDYFVPADYGSCIISHLLLKAREPCLYYFCLFVYPRLFYGKYLWLSVRSQVLYVDHIPWWRVHFTMKKQLNSCECSHQTCSLSFELLSTLEQMASILDRRLFNRCDVICFGIISILKFKGFIMFCFFCVFRFQIILESWL